MKTFILVTLMAVIPTLTFAHDCCRPDGGMSNLSAKTAMDVNWHEFESALSAAIDKASEKADAALACEYAKLYSDIYILFPPHAAHYRRIKDTYIRWSDRCEELQAEAIDEAY